MSTTTSDLTDRVLTYWFGAERPFYDPHSDMKQKWFMGGAAVDAEVRAQFGADIEAALAGRHDGMAARGQRDALALVILLDQFTRNVYRGTAKAFGGDAQAVAIAKRTVTHDMPQVREQLKPAQRAFLYTPFMHSESLDDQEMCVRLFKQLAEELAPILEAADMVKAINGNIKFAVDHRDTVLRFGRFPHRNEVLGRESTPEELEYLKTAHRYGQ